MKHVSNRHEIPKKKKGKHKVKGSNNSGNNTYNNASKSNLSSTTWTIF